MTLDPFVIDPDHVVERSRNRRILTHGGFLLSLFRLTSQSPEEPESGPPAFNRLCETFCTSSIETRGRLPGPNKIYVHNPKLAKVMGPLGAHFRTGYSLSEREREIAVNIILVKWGSAYPTNAHERAGKTAGLPADKVEAILAGLPTAFTDTREQIIYEMATCLANARWVPKGIFDRAAAALGHVGITDVITLMGFYTSVAMTLAFYDVPTDAPGMAR
jgi:4-carboxymuconolactone decarboxylase